MISIWPSGLWCGTEAFIGGVLANAKEDEESVTESRPQFKDSVADLVSVKGDVARALV